MATLTEKEQAEILRQYLLGRRVELHPATDAWMMGDRYGTIVKVNKSNVSIKMDKSGRTLKVTENNYAVLMSSVLVSCDIRTARTEVE